MLGSVKRLGSLYFENVRLKTTEKITILLAAIAFYAVAMAMGLVCLVFVSIGIGHLLATTLAPHLAYLFIAAFYLILFVLTIVFRRQIFIDPIARFVSRLLVEVPEEERMAGNGGGHGPVPAGSGEEADDDVEAPDTDVTVTGSAVDNNTEIELDYDNDEQK